MKDLVSNPNTIFLIVIGGALLYNLLQFKNYLFITVVCVYISFFFYNKPNILKEKALQRKKIESIIEKFDINEVATNVYDVFKLPKRFKYLFIKSDILDNLIELRFVMRFNKEVYMKIYIIMEQFLKLFYNSIVHRYDKSMSLDTMKQLYEELKSLKSVLKMNVPIVSNTIKRFPNSTLHEIIDKNVNKILYFMLKKIRLLKRSLVDDKIKYH